MPGHFTRLPSSLQDQENILNGTIFQPWPACNNMALYELPFRPRRNLLNCNLNVQNEKSWWENSRLEPRFQFEPYRWRPCGVTWDSSRTVVVIKLRRTSALQAIPKLFQHLHRSKLSVLLCAEVPHINLHIIRSYIFLCQLFCCDGFWSAGLCLAASFGGGNT